MVPRSERQFQEWHNGFKNGTMAQKKSNELKKSFLQEKKKNDEKPTNTFLGFFKTNLRVFKSRWDNHCLHEVGSTQKTYGYQNFFGKRISCCLNIFLLLCTHQAQKLLNLSKHAPSKMRVAERAVRARITKSFSHLQKYPQYLWFAYFCEKIKTRFSKPF